MRTLNIIAMLLLALPAVAQQLDMSSLETLKAKANNSIVVDLDPALLRFAAAFLSNQDQSEQDSEEAAALQIAEKLEAIQVRVFSFSEEGDYLAGDLDAIRAELDAADWNGIVRIEGDGGEDNVGVWVHQADLNVDGLAVVVEGSKEVVVANIVGSISPQDLIALGSQFGFPTSGIDFDLAEILEGFGAALSEQDADADAAEADADND
jgi:hypothetical protein